MTEIPSRVLAHSGYTATIAPDKWVNGAYTLTVNGTPQSHVNLDDPTQLFFEYVQRMGHVIDRIGQPGQPITAVHLGAGALTLPRYVEATRPGSRQQVIELESDLVDLVREQLPWDTRAAIRVRYGDAREVLARLPTGLRGEVDLLVVDVFSGSRTPPHVTSVEFYELAVTLLRARGILVANIADGPRLEFARAQVATLASVLPEVAVLAETQILKGRRFGNLVLVGSKTQLPFDWMPRLLAAGPHPSTIVAGAQLQSFVGGAAVTTDATATGSPPPGSIFKRRPEATG